MELLGTEQNSREQNGAHGYATLIRNRGHVACYEPGPGVRIGVESEPDAEITDEIKRSRSSQTSECETPNGKAAFQDPADHGDRGEGRHLDELIPADLEMVAEFCQHDVANPKRYGRQPD